NFIFVLMQIAILRKQYDWFQLLQFPAAILFGTAIDLAQRIIHPIMCSSYFQQWIFCILGIFLIAFGVSLEVNADLVTTPGEGVVLSIYKITPIKFGNMKMIFDIILVCISIVLSFLFLGELSGVREGTIAAAVFVGQITKQTNKLFH